MGVTYGSAEYYAAQAARNSKAATPKKKKKKKDEDKPKSTSTKEGRARRAGERAADAVWRGGNRGNAAERRAQKARVDAGLAPLPATSTQEGRAAREYMKAYGDVLRGGSGDTYQKNAEKPYVAPSTYNPDTATETPSMLSKLKASVLGLPTPASTNSDIRPGTQTAPSAIDIKEYRPGKDLPTTFDYRGPLLDAFKPPSALDYYMKPQGQKSLKELSMEQDTQEKMTEQYDQTLANLVAGRDIPKDAMKSAAVLAAMSNPIGQTYLAKQASNKFMPENIKKFMGEKIGKPLTAGYDAALNSLVTPALITQRYMEGSGTPQERADRARLDYLSLEDRDKIQAAILGSGDKDEAVRLLSEANQGQGVAKLLADRGAEASVYGVGGASDIQDTRMRESLKTGKNAYNVDPTSEQGGGAYTSLIRSLVGQGLNAAAKRDGEVTPEELAQFKGGWNIENKDKGLPNSLGDFGVDAARVARALPQTAIEVMVDQALLDAKLGGENVGQLSSTTAKTAIDAANEVDESRMLLNFAKNNYDEASSVFNAERTPANRKNVESAWKALQSHKGEATKMSNTAAGKTFADVTAKFGDDAASVDSAFRAEAQKFPEVAKWLDDGGSLKELANPKNKALQEAYDRVARRSASGNALLTVFGKPIGKPVANAIESAVGPTGRSIYNAVRGSGAAQWIPLLGSPEERAKKLLGQIGGRVMHEGNKLHAAGARSVKAASDVFTDDALKQTETTIKGAKARENLANVWGVFYEPYIRAGKTLDDAMPELMERLSQHKTTAKISEEDARVAFENLNALAADVSRAGAKTNIGLGRGDKIVGVNPADYTPIRSSDPLRVRRNESWWNSMFPETDVNSPYESLMSRVFNRDKGMTSVDPSEYEREYDTILNAFKGQSGKVASGVASKARVTNNLEPNRLLNLIDYRTDALREVQDARLRNLYGMYFGDPIEAVGFGMSDSGRNVQWGIPKPGTGPERFGNRYFVQPEDAAAPFTEPAPIPHTPVDASSMDIDTRQIAGFNFNNLPDDSARLVRENIMPSTSFAGIRGDERGVTAVAKSINQALMPLMTYLRPAFSLKNAFGNVSNSYFTGNMDVGAQLGSGMDTLKLIANKGVTEGLAPDDAARIQNRIDNGIINNLAYNPQHAYYEAGVSGDVLWKNRAMKPVTDFVQHLSSAVEAQGRAGIYETGLNRGLTGAAAKDLTNKTLFDYELASLNPAEQAWKKFDPFFTFRRRNIPFQAENILTRPAYLPSQNRLLNAIDPNNDEHQAQMDEARQGRNSTMVKVGDNVVNVPTPLSDAQNDANRFMHFLENPSKNLQSGVEAVVGGVSSPGVKIPATLIKLIGEQGGNGKYSPTLDTYLEELGADVPVLGMQVPTAIRRSGKTEIEGGDPNAIKNLIWNLTSGFSSENYNPDYWQKLKTYAAEDAYTEQKKQDELNGIAPAPPISELEKNEAKKMKADPNNYKGVPNILKGIIKEPQKPDNPINPKTGKPENNADYIDMVYGEYVKKTYPNVPLTADGKVSISAINKIQSQRNTLRKGYDPLLPIPESPKKTVSPNAGRKYHMSAPDPRTGKRHRIYNDGKPPIVTDNIIGY